MRSFALYPYHIQRRRYSTSHINQCRLTRTCISSREGTPCSLVPLPGTRGILAGGPRRGRKRRGPRAHPPFMVILDYLADMTVPLLSGADALVCASQPTSRPSLAIRICDPRLHGPHFPYASVSFEGTQVISAFRIREPCSPRVWIPNLSIFFSSC